VTDQCGLSPAPESLRDRFAMAALEGIIAGHRYELPGDVKRGELYAQWAYSYADAMLKARQVPQ
jgi:hypothetical protein